MAWVLFPVVGSLVLLALTYVTAKSENGLTRVLWLKSLATAASLFLCAPALFLHSLGSLLLAWICSIRKSGPRTVTSCSVLAMLLSYGLVLSVALGELMQRRQLRSEYPLESIAPRLAYEARREQMKLDPAAAALSPDVQDRLDRL